MLNASSPANFEQAVAAYQASLPTCASTSEQALANVLLALAHEIAALRQERQQLTASTESTLALATELRQLRGEIALLQGQSSQGKKAASHHLPGSLAPMRPVEELLDDAPQIDETLSPDQLKAYLNRSRVPVADIQLSAADIASHAHQHTHTLASHSDRQQHGANSTERGGGRAVGMLLVLTLMSVLIVFVLML